MKAELTGSIDKIRYQEGDFVIAAFKVEDGRTVTIKGDIPGAVVGLSYTIEVEEADDERFGLFYRVNVAVPDLPTSRDAIEQYMRDLPGVGPALAEKIVGQFGVNSIQRLIEEPHKVAEEVKGLSKKKALTLSEILAERRSETENIVKLRTMLRTAPPHVVKKAIKKWGANARLVLEENPYRLIALPGIGFKIADAVALEVGLERTDSRRLVEALISIIRERRQSGHTLHPLRSCCLVAQNIVNEGDTKEAISLEATQDSRLMVFEGADVVQLASDHEDESEIAAFAIERMEKSSPEVSLEIPEGLAQDQAEAFMLIQQNPGIFLLTGAPGTGKTHLVRSVIEHTGGALLLAPTGKAAKRLSLLTGREAMTIHRALGVSHGKDEDEEGWEFKHGKDDPLRTPLVVLDEASMVDTHLARQLFDAISPTTNLLIVGDSNQIPSVGPGAVLRDLVEAGVPQFELTKIKRQNPGAIVQTCHTLKDGLPPKADLMNVSDLIFKQIDGYREELRDATLHAYFVGVPSMLATKFPGRFEGMSLAERTRLNVNNIQIVTPYRKNGHTSTEELNKAIREELFRINFLETIGKFHFAKNDRIIQTSNDYEIGAYNGDTGSILGVQKDPKQLGEKDWYYRVKWDANEEADEWVSVGTKNMDWSYAITVHKSQGSEWPIVIMPLAPGGFFGRQLLYTGISRAQRFCILVGNFGNLQVIAANCNSAQRETGLQQKIAGWTEPVRTQI